MYLPSGRLILRVVPVRPINGRSYRATSFHFFRLFLFQEWQEKQENKKHFQSLEISNRWQSILEGFAFKYVEKQLENMEIQKIAGLLF